MSGSITSPYLSLKVQRSQSLHYNNISSWSGWWALEGSRLTSQSSHMFLRHFAIVAGFVGLPCVMSAHRSFDN
jgi:hypothetical protein